MKVEVAVLGSPSLIVRTVSVVCKASLNKRSVSFSKRSPGKLREQEGRAGL